MPAAHGLWTRALIGLCLWSLSCLPLGLGLGVEWGLLQFSTGLLLLLLYYLRCMIRLIYWAREPIGTPVPEGRGAWDEVFAELSLRVRQAISQRRQLAHAVDRFRAVTEAMPDGVLILRPDQGIEWMNQAAQRHFDLHLEDTGSILTNLVRQPEFIHYLQAEAYQEPLVFHPMRLIGHTLTVQVIPFAEDRRMILTRDITHLEKLETMRRDFVANVSHELKTPLTVVRGFIETLEDGLDDIGPEEARRYLHMAAEQAARMSRLVEDLLTLSALESGAPPPGDEEVDVLTLLDKVAQEADMLSAGRHQIEVMPWSDPLQRPVLLGCAHELFSALGNLAINAVRYTPEGGTITLRWRGLADGGAFEVCDTGIGIAPRDLPRLTERFYRVDRGRSRDTGGTGLGLAIVKHVLSRHQGRLEVDSELGKGSCFRACLPASRVRLVHQE